MVEFVPRLRMKTFTVAAVTGIISFVAGSVLTPQLLYSQAANPMTGTLAHIAFTTRDVDKMAAAFSDVLGVKVNPGRVVRNVPFPPSYGPGAVMNVKFTQFQANGVTFELLEPLDGPSPWKDHLEKHGEGMHHIGFNVADIPVARAFLESKGGKWTQAASPTGAYVDMHPLLPFTFEIFGPRQAPPGAQVPATPQR
jgi:methylmalonyl-CoA/ethylmalonyl-CoA epimerase